MLYPLTECSTNPLVTFRNITLQNVTTYHGLFPPGVIRCDPTNPCQDINFINVNHYGFWRWFGPGFYTQNAYGLVKNSYPDPNIQRNFEKKSANQKLW